MCHQCLEHVTGRCGEVVTSSSAVCCCAVLGQVCPANWKPGDKTIVADPEKSLEYFESANKVCTQPGILQLLSVPPVVSAPP